MWEMVHKEDWALKTWCLRIVVLEKTLECPLHSKEIKPVNPKGNQSWLFIGRTDTEAEAPILWPPDAISRFIGKDPDAGKDWGQEEKGVTEGEMVGWHHRLNGYEFEQTQETVKDREAWCAAVLGVPKSWTPLSDWPTTNLNYFLSGTISKYRHPGGYGSNTWIWATETFSPEQWDDYPNFTEKETVRTLICFLMQWVLPLGTRPAWL